MAYALGATLLGMRRVIAYVEALFAGSLVATAFGALVKRLFGTVTGGAALVFTLVSLIVFAVATGCILAVLGPEASRSGSRSRVATGAAALRQPRT